MCKTIGAMPKMYNQAIKTIVAIAFIFASSVSAQQNDSMNVSVDDTAIRSVINNFLIAAGNYDTDAMPAMFTENANIGGVSFKK